MRARWSVLTLVVLVFAGVALAAPIHQAIYAGDLKKIEALLVADPTQANALDEWGRTPLVVACERNGDAQPIVELLLARGADPNAVAKDGRRPLEVAALTQRVPAVRALLAAGADPKLGGEAGRDLLFIAAGLRNADLVTLALGAGCLPTATDANGNTPLHLMLNETAAHADDPLADAAVEALSTGLGTLVDMFAPAINHMITTTMGVNAQLWPGRVNWEPMNTPISPEEQARLDAEEKARRAAIDACARLLVEKGAPVNAANKFGGTPALGAASSGVPDTLKYLVERGADVKIVDGRGQTAVHRAAALGNAEALTYLKRKRCDLSAKDAAGNTPLHVAAKTCSQSALEFLLDEGLDANVRNTAGQTPLHFVVLLRTPKLRPLVNALKFAGADLNAQDNNGNTPLHVAAAANSNEGVLSLLMKNARKDIKNTDGKLPADVARGDVAKSLKK